MPIDATLPLDPRDRRHIPADNRVNSADFAGSAGATTSAVSWGAIIAGAAAGAALSLILLILGVGLGLSSVSPWSSEGISTARLGVSTIVWLTLTQLLSSAMGGYLAGRLRTRWMDTPVDEIYFRDTAHGFLAWAVASLTTAVLLTAVIGSILSGGVQAAASVVDGAAKTAAVAADGVARSGQISPEDRVPVAYFVDALFRRSASTETASPSESPTPPEMSARPLADEASEVSRIFINFSRFEFLPPADVQYVGQLVAQRTGLSQPQAEKRVTDIYARARATLKNAELAAKEAADQARKASAYAALWMFVSLLVGAFVASLAATYGGRQRDA